MILFKKNIGRSSIINTIFNLLLFNKLNKLSSIHLNNNRKQLSVFSFDYIAHSINIYGVYEIDALDALFDWIKGKNTDIFDGTAVDIGANIGNHSVYFSELFKKVISFEPNKRTFSLLSLNSELSSNIVAHNYGLSDAEGEVSLNIVPNNTGRSFISNDLTDNSAMIELRTLDSVIDSNERVTLIKIDVEGHEYQALKGAAEVIKKNRPIILFEQLEQEFVDGSSPVIELLKTLKYDNFVTVEKHPKLTRAVPAVLYNPILAVLRSIFGVSMRVSTCDYFEPKFYPFIVALPD